MTTHLFGCVCGQYHAPGKALGMFEERVTVPLPFYVIDHPQGVALFDCGLHTDIGDTTVGEGSNIGAGTITANYDGVEKHATTVGSHVRTGSHNVFVAPVTIGDGAYSGAGTVIRKNVPPGALAINVAPQRNSEGWVAAHRAGTKAAQAAAEASD